MSKAQYDKHGNRVLEHEHRWVQAQVTLWPSPVAQTPVNGVTVSWRCTKRGCHSIYQKEYKFRRPNKDTAGNTYARPLPELATTLAGKEIGE